MLAGISSDYYLRLEQGRDRNPSVQVLDALAEVLQLDADATAYLVELTREQPRSRKQAVRRRPAKPEQVPASVLGLIEGWPNNPAYVQDKFSEVLAVNPPAAALSPNYAVGVNLLRAVFLDPAERELRRDWEDTVAEGVATLRAHVGPDVDDPRLVELVGELSVRSDLFRQLWGRHTVRPKRSRISHLRHPAVGDLDLTANKLVISGTGLGLVVFHAEPGSRSVELLGLLGSLAAGTASTLAGEADDVSDRTSAKGSVPEQ